MAKEQEVCLPVLDELVKEYAQGILNQSTGAWKQCDAMRQALRNGDVDTGLAIMRVVCPSALEDVRVVFRAKKQKFVELLRSGGDPEAALACARSELAPLALDAYPEAYGEFKRLLLLLLLVPKRYADQQPEASGDASRQVLRQPGLSSACDSSGYMSGGGGLRLGAAAVFSGADSTGLWDPASTAEFADLAYFTVRSMLGLEQPLLSLQLRFLLRLHGSYGSCGPAAGREGAAVAAELGPRLRVVRGATTGGDRDTAPLPPLTSGGSGGGPPCFPESRVQAVIHGAGTSRAAAMDALKRSGGDALEAFKAEVGRLRLNEQLLAELVLEYGRFRGLLSAQEADALEARAAGGSGSGGGAKGACEPSAAATATAAAQPTSRLHSVKPQQEHQEQPQQEQQPQQRHLQGQQQQQECFSGTTTGPGRSGPAADPGPGPLGLARGDASWAGGSPPNKVARRSPPAEEVAEGAEGGDGGGGDGKANSQQVALETDRRSAEGPGQPSTAWPSTPSSASEGAAAGMDGGPGDRAAPGETSQRPDPGPGSGSGSAAAQQKRGQNVLSELLRLGQDGDAVGVLSLVESVDPALWAEHPALLFDVRRCQYGKLLAEGKVTQALELARRELTPLANANPALLPLLKSAMAALLPPLPEEPQAAPPSGSGDGAAAPSATNPCSFMLAMQNPLRPLPASTVAASGSARTPGSSSLLPSLPVVVGAIQSVLQPRMGLQGPRMVRLMEGLLASHRAWLRAEKMTSDPFAEAMRITALRATTPSTAAATTAAGASVGTASLARQQSGGAGAAAAAPPSQPLPPPPLPLASGFAGMGAAARALERALRETGAADRGLVNPWFEMEQQILAQMNMPYGREVPGPPPGGLYGVFGGGVPGLRHDEEHGAAGAGGLGGAAAAGAAGAAGVMVGEDDDDDDGSGGDGGMDVDEEGVLSLMEILELPRGAAVELLQNHDGDVQAAVLSVMQ